MNDFLIERLTSDKFCEVAELERLCFSLPWSEKSLELLLDGKNVGFVVIDKATGRVAAYGGMIAVLDEGQITNIATHPEYRRRGLGQSVLHALVEYATETGLNIISLEVRESNVAAISLYEKLGFLTAGVRKNFYTSPRENGIVMTKSIGELTV